MCLGYVAWQTWGAEHVARKYYGIRPESISVTPAPEYVRTDIVDTVYRDMAMDELSLLDRQACSKIASAFNSNPWVRHVTGVTKLSGSGLDVRLEYRQPVAMVHVISRHPEYSGAGFFAVDGEGTLLPRSDFSEADVHQYLHIIAPGAYPTGRIGAAFGDVRIEAAALLAHFLHPDHKELGLTSIGVHGDLRQNPVVQLEIAGEGDQRWFWGSPPGQEVPGEPTAQMKLDTLRAGAATGSDLRQVYVAP